MKRFAPSRPASPAPCTLARVQPSSQPRDADALHGARLLFARELEAGRLDDAAVAAAARRPEVRAAVAPRRIPGRLRRLAQLVRRRRGQLSAATADQRATAARRAVLGDDAAGPPRFLVRVDEFPHVGAWEEGGRYGTAAYERFHAIMAEAGLPYLIAVPPRVSRAPMDPADPVTRPLTDGEIAKLHQLAGEGVAFALHGRDHGTRDPSPRRHSELCGLDATATQELLDGALGELAACGVARPETFVPPFNRFDAAQLPALAARFPVVCGGPESIGLIGFHGPHWRDGSLYLPSYAPLYGRAAAVLPAAEALIDAAPGWWAPVTLHWGWEADDGWEDLRRLARALAPHAAPWEALLADVRAERARAGRDADRGPR